MSIDRFSGLIRALLDSPHRPVVAVVNAHDAATLEAVKEGVDNGLIRASLIGKGDSIRAIMEAVNLGSEGVDIIEAATDEEAARLGVALVCDGRADVLMKGMIQTKDFLKAVVHPEWGIRKERLLSHVALLEIPGYSKFICLTDGGMVMNPDLAQKKELIRNAVAVMRHLGIECPKVAVLAAVEKVNEAMPETLDAAELKRLNQLGDIENCLVEGPISFDLAFSKESAEAKCYSSPVTGEPDILLLPDIASGNILAKALVHAAGGVMAGVVAGARVPIVVTSRGATVEEKLNSLALAARLSYR